MSGIAGKSGGPYDSGGGGGSSGLRAEASELYWVCLSFLVIITMTIIIFSVRGGS